MDHTLTNGTSLCSRNENGLLLHGGLDIPSAWCPMERRKVAWERLLTDLPMNLLDQMTQVISLENVPEWGARILKGQVRGRVVVDLQR